MQCPCNPNKKYSDCCKKAHQNINSVTSAEVLMRSRYSAFVLANIEYLQKSHHSTTRPSKQEKREIEKWTKSVNWLKLEILNSTNDTVAFKAFFMENGSINVIQENSNFSKENGNWAYLGANE
jgi:SEC-C motif-containing protein